MTSTVPTLAEAETAWHALEIDDVAARLDVTLLGGLPSQEAAARLLKFGANAIRAKPPRSSLRILADQFADFMIVVLMAAAVFSGLVGDLKDALAILVIVILNAAIGFVQELRAEHAMAALKKMAGTNARVRRNGRPMEVPAPDVVVGDVLLLEAGQVVAADMRLFEIVQLKLDEALLTGEALPVEKSVAPLTTPAQALGDRFNMAFKGTTVAYGRAAGVVVATGMTSELGRLPACSIQPKSR